MMKRNILLVLLSLLVIIMKAANYKILKMNHPQILINGKLAKEGDVFHGNDVIKWTKDKQAMKVLDMDSKKRYLFVARPHEKKEQTVMEILTRINHLSTHGPSDDTMISEFDRLENSIATSYDLFDAISIPTTLVVDKEHYFLGSYKYGDTRIIKRLKHQDGNLIIDKTLFLVDNKCLDPRDVELTIDYVVRTLENAVFIKDNIQLTIIPDVLE